MMLLALKSRIQHIYFADMVHVHTGQAKVLPDHGGKQNFRLPRVDILREASPIYTFTEYIIPQNITVVTFSNEIACGFRYYCRCVQ